MDISAVGHTLKDVLHVSNLLCPECYQVCMLTTVICTINVLVLVSKFVIYQRLHFIVFVVFTVLYLSHFRVCEIVIILQCH